MIATLNEIWVITCWEWREKKNKNWSILMSSQDNAIAMFCDEQLWRSSFSLIQTYLLIPVLIFKINCFFLMILCTWCHFSTPVNIFNFCFANLFLKVIEVLFSRIYSVTAVLWIFNNSVICNILQSCNVCIKSTS